VLKDILLVVLSVIIWSTPITAIQMIGYSIALGGLIWYKIGGDQAYAAYTKLAGDENSTFNRFRRSLWAKVGAGVLILFVVFALFHGLTRGQGYDSAAVDTSLTGTPQPIILNTKELELHLSMSPTCLLTIWFLAMLSTEERKVWIGMTMKRASRLLPTTMLHLPTMILHLLTTILHRHQAPITELKISPLHDH